MLNFFSICFCFKNCALKNNNCISRAGTEIETDDLKCNFKTQFSPFDLWDVVLCSLWGRKGHGCHGHHDWLVSGVDSRRGSL